ncbi:uncharacterized protein LOC131658240 [Vicia villosa]|uniref:uncharacterized protein LOC131658240 n=1 Tax=Vicia villosa TaxID=3911 RepID=UPI00273A8529|nr:uncharacterized protein LOC131658240 [Vicia villosa]
MLWEELKSLSRNMIGGWMVVGDFNDIDVIRDKKGGLPASIQSCQRMRSRMEDCNLNNVEARGPKFTWKGPVYHGGQRIYEKLDRALSNDDWKFQFPDAFVQVLVRVDFSDHHPILINLQDNPPRVQKRNFRFESAWLMHDSYQPMLHEVWQKDQPLIQNLRNVVKGIEHWKFESFDQVKRMKKRLMRRLEGVQVKLQVKYNYGGMRKLEKQLQKELNEILSKEEMMWFKRSRTVWLADGDRNTKYYHMKTLNRRRRNKIMSLKDEKNNWITDQEDLKAHVTMFYKKLFSCPQSWRSWGQTRITFPKLNKESL